MSLNEGLHANDLEYLVKKVFEIDSFRSKIGNDEDICVLSFTVSGKEAADDLENFIELGHSFVLDSDTSPGETDDNTYKVYVEIERNRHIGDQVFEIIEGVKKICALDDMRFRYFKSFKSEPATLENLKAAIPINKAAYKVASEDHRRDNFTEFFSRSYAENINVMEDTITFKRAFSGPVTFDIVHSGPRQEVYDAVSGPIMLEGKDMAEVMFLTKVIGNYNITKIGNDFVFENDGWAVALKRKV